MLLQAAAQSVTVDDVQLTLRELTYTSSVRADLTNEGLVIRVTLHTICNESLLLELICASVYTMITI